MKKLLKVFIATLLIVAAVTLVACTDTDKEYFKRVSDYSFWDNKGAEAIAQYKFYDIMDKYLSDGDITDGNAVKDGKVKKVLFLGWDGARADSLTNIFWDSNNFDTNSYNYEPDDYSGLHKLKEQGGLYLAYAGGETGTDSEQSSSTCAGWTSELTGGWNTKHGVKENSDIKKEGADTIMMKYAKLGLNTGLAFDWGQLFDITFRTEVSELLKNPDLASRLRYRDIDRTKADNNADIMRNEEIQKEEQINAIDLAHYNAVAMEGDIHPKAKYDIGMRDYLLGRIEAGDDFVGGIFHRPDTNGHTTGFGNDNAHYVNSVRNADIYLYQMLQVIEEREETYNEDWLVIVTADHGGSGRDHGKQVYEHRTIWIATNKAIDSSYYGKNYDGFNERG